MLRRKKSAPLGENIWTVDGKDSIILWSLLAKYGFFIKKKKKKLYSITTLWTTETPSLGKTWTLAELVPYQEECLHPCHIVRMSSSTQCHWDSRLLQLLGPTMERDGSRLRLCFSFNGLAGCVQGPGVNLFSGCSRLGSLGREKR